ncbi:MAG: tripartite tricarboxylate transporter substrate binding protein [Reyranellaceae bacterium]
MIGRRGALALGLALAPALALTGATGARAEAWPQRPLRLVVPFPPGGATDVTARLFAAGLAEELKQTVVVDNKPGAAGAIGIAQVAKARPDGYTLGVGGVGPIAILPATDGTLAYDPARDLRIVAGLSLVDFILVARPGFPATTVDALIARAKAEPGRLTYSSAGVAGPQQLMVEHLAALADIRLVHVPFAGDSPAVAAVAAGEVDLALAGAASALPLIKAGKLVALAAGSGRLPGLPDLPSVAEQTGFRDFLGRTWNILVVPKETPDPIVARLEAAAAALADQPGFAARLAEIGLRPMPGDGAAITRLVADDSARYRAVIERIGLRRE